MLYVYDDDLASFCGVCELPTEMRRQIKVSAWIASERECDDDCYTVYCVGECEYMFVCLFVCWQEKEQW